MLFIHRYNPGSRSARALRDGLGARFIRTENSQFRGNENKIVINWGDSNLTNPEVLNAIVLNQPQKVAAATNKRTFFQSFHEHLNLPEFTLEKEEAETWLRDGKKVVIREKLTGHSGEGIVLMQDLARWDEYNHSLARLYVLYVPKMEEYRVHVFGNEVADIQQKRIRSDFPRESVNHQIRNHQNGFIYARENVQAPPQVTEQALRTIEVTGLDFGAVDVIWNRHRQSAFVLEVNTAPGLEGQTVESYIQHFSRLEEQTRNVPRTYRQSFLSPTTGLNIATATTSDNRPSNTEFNETWTRALNNYVRSRRPTEWAVVDEDTSF